MIRRVLTFHVETSGVRGASHKSSSKGGMFGFAKLTKRETQRLERLWEERKAYFNARMAANNLAAERVKNEASALCSHRKSMDVKSEVVGENGTKNWRK